MDGWIEDGGGNLISMGGLGLFKLTSSLMRKTNNPLEYRTGGGENN